MIALLVGCSIGLVLGLTGAGGSVLAVPLLIFVLQYSPELAVMASLATVFATASFGVLTRLKNKEMVWVPAIAFAVGGLAFAPVGVYLAQYLSAVWHMATFTILMLVVAIRMFIQSIQDPGVAGIVRAQSNADFEQSSPMCPLSETNQFEPRLRCLGMLAFAGAFTGVLSGIYGVGGGFLIVPVLTAITQLNMRQAVGTSLFVIAVISAAGFLGYLLKNETGELVANPSLVQVIAGALVGMLVGTFLSKKIAGPRLQQFFVLVILMMASFTLFNMDKISSV